MLRTGLWLAESFYQNERSLREEELTASRDSSRRELQELVETHEAQLLRLRELVVDTVPDVCKDSSGHLRWSTKRTEICWWIV